MTNSKQPSVSTDKPGDAAGQQVFDARLAPPAQGGIRIPRLAIVAGATGLAVASALFLIAGYAVWHAGPAVTPKAEDKPTAAAAEPGDPIDIVPAASSDGVTVLVKQPDPAPVEIVPAASGSQVGSGWSVDLGGALSFSDLSRRFADVALTNQEIPFDRLEPRATIRETAQGLEARLLVGPFANAEEAQAVCDSIALPADVPCRPATFEGELISRE